MCIYQYDGRGLLLATKTSQLGFADGPRRTNSAPNRQTYTGNQNSYTAGRGEQRAVIPMGLIRVNNGEPSRENVSGFAKPLGHA